MFAQLLCCTQKPLAQESSVSPGLFPTGSICPCTAALMQLPPGSPPPSATQAPRSGVSKPPQGQLFLTVSLTVQAEKIGPLILFFLKYIYAAKSLQSCPTLCDPIDGNPPGSPIPGDSPGKNTGVGCHFLLQCMKVKSESEVTQSCPTLATPRTAAHQAPPSMGFSRQKHWSGVPLPSPLSHQGSPQIQDSQLNLNFR